MRLYRQGSSLVVRTPAKLNLFLDVLGKRPDGYHELETLMVSIGLFDTLRFEPNDSGRLELFLSVGSPGIPRDLLPLLPLDERNLILKAAKLLQEVSGVTRGVHITLQKSIPMQAGLGGGSSDAAAALIGLNTFWQLGLRSDQLHLLAAQLGSDVNFFLDSVPLAVCRGRGERILPIPLTRPLHFVLCKPSGGLSTRDVFQQLQMAPPHGSGQIQQALRGGQVHHIGTQLHNSLEVPARQLSAEVTHTLSAMGRVSQVGYLMTGSGSSCFALCSHQEQAVRAAHQLRSLLSPSSPASQDQKGSRCRSQVYVVQTST